MGAGKSKWIYTFNMVCRGRRWTWNDRLARFMCFVFMRFLYLWAIRFLQCQMFDAPSQHCQFHFNRYSLEQNIYFAIKNFFGCASKHCSIIHNFNVIENLLQIMANKQRAHACFWWLSFCHKVSESMHSIWHQWIGVRAAAQIGGIESFKQMTRRTHFCSYTSATQ